MAAQTPPLDPDERAFVCEALERVGTTNAIATLAGQRIDAAAWALGNIGGAGAERALLNFPPTLAALLALDRLHSTNCAPWIPYLVSQMAQITYRSHPDDVMNDELQPIQRVGVNLIRRSGLAPVLIEAVVQELEDTMKPAIPHGPRPAHPAEWNDMFKRMHSELKPGFVREDGTTTSQPIVAMCYLLGNGDVARIIQDTTATPPSPLNGERAGVKGRDDQERVTKVNAAGQSHPLPLTPLTVEGRGEPDEPLVERLVALLHHPAVVPRVYVALALGRMHASGSGRRRATMRTSAGAAPCSTKLISSCAGSPVSAAGSAAVVGMTGWAHPRWRHIRTSPSPRPSPPRWGAEENPTQSSTNAVAFGRESGTGLILCNSIFKTDQPYDTNAVRYVRVLEGVQMGQSIAANASFRTRDLGTAPVHRDGSFFIEVPADVPIRFQLLDHDERMLIHETDFMYVRAGETKGCVAVMRIARKPRRTRTHWR